MVSAVKRTFKDIFPFDQYIIEELAQNHEGGRIAYKVVERKEKGGKSLFVNQFRFADSSDWTGYEYHQRELRALKRLSHAAIPKLVDCHETSDGFLLVQEFMDAPTLSSLIGRRDFIAKEIMALNTAVLLVLEYLHEEGNLCHGDIHPGNILVDLTGGISVYLVDFGLARSFNCSVVQTGMLCGTPEFTAPDLLCNPAVPPHGDIYGWAATLISLITTTCSEDFSRLRDSKTSQFNFRKLVKVPMPKYFLKWLERCVSPDPKERYHTARLALNALNALKQSEELFVAKPRIRWRLVIPLGLVLGGGLVGAVSFNQARWAEQLYLKYAEIEEQANDLLRDANLRIEERRKEELRRQEEQQRLAAEAQSREIFERRRVNTQTLLATRACVGCDLQGVDFSRINLDGVNLQNADLTGAVIESARLVGANLAGATLDKVNLSDSNISRANFSEARMEQADLRRVNGEGAVFRGARIVRSNLGSAILHGSNFVGADLTNADLGSAKFKGANLEMADLDGTFIFFTSFQDARMPNGFNR